MQIACDKNQEQNAGGCAEEFSISSLRFQIPNQKLHLLSISKTEKKAKPICANEAIVDEQSKSLVA